MLILYFILTILILGGVALLFSLLKHHHRRNVINKSAHFVLYNVKIVRKELEPGRNQKEEEVKWIDLMKQLFSNLADTEIEKGGGTSNIASWMVFEIAKIRKEIFFFVAVDKKRANFLEKQIYSLFPESEIIIMERDYNIFALDEHVLAGYFKLKKSFYLPIKTYQQMERDPLATITGTLIKLEEEEEAVIQLVIKNKPINLQSSSSQIVAKLREGKSFKQSCQEISTWGQLRSIFSASQKQSEKSMSIQRSPDEEVLKGVLEKSSMQSFSANLRIVVSTPNRDKSNQLFANLMSVFEQFSAPKLNSLKMIKMKEKSLREIVFDFSFRLFNKKQTMILSTEEMASFFHFPEPFLKVPKIRFLEAKTSAPPTNLPKQGLLLGHSFYRETEIEAKIQLDDRRRHLYVIGQTGTGKTTLLKNLIIQDIKNDQGVCVLDPHGDLIDDILAQIPERRIADLVLFEPGRLEDVIGLNMLEYDIRFPEQKTFIVNELINIFDKLYDLKQTGGPMFEMYTRNALLLLMDDPQEIYTLMEVPKVLSDDKFRNYLLNKCKNIIVKEFWKKEAIGPQGQASLKEIVPYITSKFNVFIANDYVRPIIGQQKTSLNFSDIMNQRKILLCNLSKGKLGEINMSLLGLILVGKMALAAFARTDISYEERKDFYLYLDEFQNFTTDSIATILSEARKYRLSLIIAHQFIGQLTEPIQKAVFGNVGNIGAFRVGPIDAEFLEKQFTPIFDKTDLINIDNFNFYVKLSIDGHISRPFNLKTIYYYEPKLDGELVKRMREYSSIKYGRSREIVEEEIIARRKQIDF